jgi:hypothetical protein
LACFFQANVILAGTVRSLPIEWSTQISSAFTLKN